MFTNQLISRRQYTLVMFVLLSLFAVSSTAQAHFVWAYSGDGKIKVVFGEGLEPDQAQFLSGLKTMKTYKVTDGKRHLIKLAKKTEDDFGWFETSLENSGHIVDVHVPYGVFGRGDKTMVLDYSAKYFNATQGSVAKPNKELTLDLVPTYESGQLKVVAYFQGYPIEGVEIQAERLESDYDYATTDVSGQAMLSPASRYVIRGTHIVEEAGEISRIYCDRPDG